MTNHLDGSSEQNQETDLFFHNSFMSPQRVAVFDSLPLRFRSIKRPTHRTDRYAHSLVDATCSPESIWYSYSVDDRLRSMNEDRAPRREKSPVPWHGCAETPCSELKRPESKPGIGGVVWRLPDGKDS